MFQDDTLYKLTNLLTYLLDTNMRLYLISKVQAGWDVSSTMRHRQNGDCPADVIQRSPIVQIEDSFGLRFERHQPDAVEMVPDLQRRTDEVAQERLNQFQVVNTRWLVLAYAARHVDHQRHVYHAVA